MCCCGAQLFCRPSRTAATNLHHKRARGHHPSPAHSATGRAGQGAVRTVGTDEEGGGEITSFSSWRAVGTR